MILAPWKVPTFTQLLLLLFSILELAPVITSFVISIIIPSPPHPFSFSITPAIGTSTLSPMAILQIFARVDAELSLPRLIPYTILKC